MLIFTISNLWETKLAGLHCNSWIARFTSFRYRSWKTNKTNIRDSFQKCTNSQYHSKWHLHSHLGGDESFPWPQQVSGSSSSHLVLENSSPFHTYPQFSKAYPPDSDSPFAHVCVTHTAWSKIHFCWFWGFHMDNFDKYGYQGYNTIQFRESLTFQRNIHLTVKEEHLAICYSEAPPQSTKHYKPEDSVL